MPAVKLCGWSVDAAVAFTVLGNAGGKVACLIFLNTFTDLGNAGCNSVCLMFLGTSSLSCLPRYCLADLSHAGCEDVTSEQSCYLIIKWKWSWTDYKWFILNNINNSPGKECSVKVYFNKFETISLVRDCVHSFFDCNHYWNTTLNIMLGKSGHPSSCTQKRKFTKSVYRVRPPLASVQAWHLLLTEHTEWARKAWGLYCHSCSCSIATAGILIHQWTACLQ